MHSAIGARSTVRDVADAIRAAQRITAICHENPDGDTLGAAIAMRLIGERLGAETEVVSVDAPSPIYAYLPGIDHVRRAPALAPDLAVTCDAATLGRIGRLHVDHAEWLAKSRILNVDHHVSNAYYGHLNLVDAQASATCQVVASLVQELGIELDPDLATALLTGIVRDSRGFADATTSGATLRLAADLVDAGAPLSRIHRIILSEMSWTKMALWGRMLQAMGHRLDRRVVYTVLTEEMLVETGAGQEDADGFVEFISATQDAAIALLCRAVGPNETRVSIRTDDSIDATVVAQAFDGGGHRRRAGCAIAEPLDVALDRVLRASTATLRG